MRPLFYDPSETIATQLPTPAKVPLSPTMTSHSSTSLQPQPTVSSIYSSRHGSGFIPSHHTAPTLAQRKSTPSKSNSPSTGWNPFASPNTPISNIKFVPETNFEMEFSPRVKSMDKDKSDMKSVWTMVEEQKQEEQHLRTELGWGSQSGISASQVSLQQQRHQSQDGLSSFLAQQIQNYVDAKQSPILNRQGELIQTQEGRMDSMLQQWKQTKRSNQEGSSGEEVICLQSSSKPEIVGRKAEPTSFEESHDTNAEIILSCQNNSRNVSGAIFKHKKDEKLGAEKLQDQHVTHPNKDLEEEEGDEDEGIPWF